MQPHSLWSDITTLSLYRTPENCMTFQRENQTVYMEHKENCYVMITTSCPLISDLWFRSGHPLDVLVTLKLHPILQSRQGFKSVLYYICYKYQVKKCLKSLLAKPSIYFSTQHLCLRFAPWMTRGLDPQCYHKNISYTCQYIARNILFNTYQLWLLLPVQEVVC